MTRIYIYFVAIICYSDQSFAIGIVFTGLAYVNAHAPFNVATLAAIHSLFVLLWSSFRIN